MGAVYFAAGPLPAAMIPDVGWSRGLVTAVLLVRGPLAAGMGLLTGRLVSHFGVRTTVRVGGVTDARVQGYTPAGARPSRMRPAPTRE
ncbi:hypothetical protein C5E44_02705 [Nocardia nova]|uniref:hypothetical protein n=1 Tax=Nocardia nova TaxID=37330 RepID=UPI000CE9CA06|nr:hypothetical protein C5E44_02705 [Nocardia nova]